jgi:hypothetical protein
MNTLQSYESASSLSDYSKNDIIQLAIKQSDEIILAGSAEQAWAFLSKLELLISETKERIKNDAINEIDKGNDHAFGVKMKVQSRETTSFKNSKAWLKIEEKKKDFEKFLKSLSEPTSILDEETGEVIKHEPPVKSTSTFIKTDF